MYLCIHERTSHMPINPITTCIPVYPGLIETLKQPAYICEETGGHGK